MKSINWLNIEVMPKVNASVMAVNPTPRRVLKNSRNRVAATLNVKVATVKPVWRRRRSRSFIGKPAPLLIATRQFAVF